MAQRQVSRQELAYKLGITPYGLDKMIANRTMKVELLEKMSKFLDVPITYWFSDSENIQPEIKNESTKVDNNIERLFEQLKIKDSQITFLQSLIEKQK